jgi:alpha-N-arabinofuranosidase
VTPDKDIETSFDIEGIENFSIVKSNIITSEKMNAYNDFGKQEEVNIREFKGIHKEGSSIKVNIPSKSVLLISLSVQ